jgi:glycosyltransferase involved in cell wall biosynthesis
MNWTIEYTKTFLTHGMAHGLDTVLRAAEMLRGDERIRFLLAGDGAERERLLREKERLGIENVIMLPQQPKERMPELLAASDACMVLLKKQDLFKTVIPSKIFEAMAMERPVILGVEGESRRIIEEAGCGVGIEPENASELAGGVVKLAGDRGLVESLGQNGRKFVEAHYDRDALADRYFEVIKGLND